MGPKKRVPVRLRTSRRGGRPPEPESGNGHVHLGLLFLLGLLLAMLAGCGSPEGGDADPAKDPQGQGEAMTLGPRDGQDLPPTELDRVGVGALAPDFSLVSLSGDTVTLSSFRGAKKVILVFYRGHW